MPSFKMRPTTIECCAPILKLLKFTGVFRYRIPYFDKTPYKQVLAENEKIFKVELDSRWGYVLISWLFRIYGSTKLLIFAWKLACLTFIDKSANLADVLTNFTLTNVSLVLVLLNTILSVKTPGIIQFLNQWHEAENTILNSGGVYTTAADYSKKIYRYHLYEFLIFTTISLTVASGAIYQSPRHPIALYSMLEPTTELHWFYVISFLDVLLTMTSQWLITLHGIFYVIVFPESVHSCIKLLTKETTHSSLHPLFIVMEFDQKFSKNGVEHIPPLKPLRINGVIHAMKMYCRLQLLIHTFNALLANSLLYVKFLCLFTLCGTIVLTLQYSSTSPSLHTGFVAAYAVFVASILFRLLVAMGRVAEESKQFQISWLKNLPHVTELTSKERQKCKLVLTGFSALQFRCGKYYGVSTSTILTYISIVTTYVIVLLQI